MEGSTRRRQCALRRTVPPTGEKLTPAPTISCASATTRWCWASGSANGAGTGRCSRSTSASPTSRSTWSGRRRCCSAKRRRRPARFPPRRARLPELPAGRAAQRRLRADDRPAPALHDVAAHAASAADGVEDKFLSEFAHKAVKEVAYHRELASEWTIRLGDGTEESAGGWRKDSTGIGVSSPNCSRSTTTAGRDRSGHRARPARV